jgi:hypothetical protein
MENFGDSGDWWTSTRSTMKFRDPVGNAKIEEILKTAPIEIDPSILAADIGVAGGGAQHVRAYQRRLGLRAPAVSGIHKSNRSALDTRGGNKTSRAKRKREI